MDRLNLIRFNDDNHAERLWLNGTYIGDLSNIGSIIQNSIVIIKDLNDDYKFEDISVYVCDDFDDVDDDDVDRIWEFFNKVEQISEKQMKLIIDKNWKELLKTI